MIYKLKEELQQRKGQQKALVKELDNKEATIFTLNDYLLDLEEAVLIVQKVAKDTQQSLFASLNRLVTEALDIVFVDEGYSFELQADSKANGLQVTPVLKQYGHEYSLKADTGYGITQVIALSLRTALLAIKKKSTKIILLDEPNVAVSKEYKEKASELMSTIANKMGMQIIAVTHQQEIKEVADHTFLITKNKEGSQVEELISE